MEQKGWKSELGIMGLLLVGVLYPMFVPVGASEMVQRGAASGASGAGQTFLLGVEQNLQARVGQWRGAGARVHEGIWLQSRA